MYDARGNLKFRQRPYLQLVEQQVDVFSNKQSIKVCT